MALCALLILPRAAAAQNDTGSLRVLVQDSSDAALPGADVTVTNVATGVADHRVSNGEGYVLLTPVTRGTYGVEVSLSGFGTVQVTDVVVDVQQTRLVHVKLAPAQVTETISVKAEAAPIQSEKGSLGQTIKSDVIQELPLSARRSSDLALLAPGAAPSTVDTVSRGPGWFVVNGTSHTQNNFTLDGFDNNQGTTNMQSLSAQVVQPSPDAISEIRVQTNSFSAEFGRSAGAVVNVSLKSGTNQIHGSAWEYNRDKAFAAKTWESNLVNGPKDNLQWNQYGGTLGGPTFRNRLFFFGTYEGFRSDRSDTALTQVPTAAERTGVFPFPVTDPLTGQPFPNNTIPANRMDPLGVKLANLFPDANLPGRAGSGGRIVENYTVQTPSTERTHKFDTRHDLNISDTDRMFVRYSFMQQDIFRAPLFPAPADDGGSSGRQYNRNQSVGVNWTRVMGHNTVNEARIGYTRTYAEFSHATLGGMTGTEFGFIGIPPELDSVGGLPRIQVTNYNNFGPGGWLPQYQAPHAWQFMDSLTFVHGTHATKIGGEVRLKYDKFVDVQRRTPEYRFTGQYTNDGLGDMLLGWPFTMKLNNFMEAVQLQNVYAGYVQDDWKVAPQLTLNLGLRYEYATPTFGEDPYQNVNFDFATGQTVQGTDSNPYLVTTDKNNVAPRLGVAWQLVPERMVVRGGYGLFYGGEDFRGSTGGLLYNPPNLFNLTIQPPASTPPPYKLSDPFPAFMIQQWDPSLSTSTTLQIKKPDQPAARFQQWNIAYELRLPLASTIEVAYVGNRGKNIIGSYAANQTPWGVDGGVPANRPYPEWQGINTLEAAATSAYDGLQLKFERRLSRGWYNLTSYTYARAFGETSGFGVEGSPQSGNDWASEWAPDSQTPRHLLSITNIYQLPIGRGRAMGRDMSRLADFLIGGWQVSSIYTWRTGLPVSVTLPSSGTNPATGQRFVFLSRNGGGLRPNLVGQPNTGIDPADDRFHFLDPAAYAVQPVNTPGNAPRNSAWGPRFSNLDISIIKRFRLDATRAFDFRLEAFNAFNSTRFRSPNGSFTGANFGIISSAYAPRTVQMALRFAF
jgi:hypothetical protein